LHDPPYLSQPWHGGLPLGVRSYYIACGKPLEAEPKPHKFVRRLITAMDGCWAARLSPQGLPIFDLIPDERPI